MLCDAAIRAGATDRGEDTDRLADAYVGLITAAFADRPQG